MNKQNLIDCINDIMGADCATSDSFNLSMFLVEKTRHKKYFFHVPSIAQNIKSELKNSLLGYLSTIVRDKYFEIYNPSGYEEGTLEYMGLDEISQYSVFTECMTNEDFKNTDIDDQTKYNMAKLSFYCVELHHNENKLLLFKRYSSPKSLRKWLPCKFISSTLTRLEDELFFIDNSFDLVIYNDEILIINRYALEIIFEYKDTFYQFREAALNKIQELDLIENFDEFAGDCRLNISTAKKFTSIMKENSLEGFSENRDMLKEVVEHIGFDLVFNESNQIIYRGKDDLKLILILLGDNLAKTILGEKLINAKVKGGFI